MKTVILAFVALAIATSARAEPFEGLKPGASGADARTHFDHPVPSDTFAGGYNLTVMRPDGRILSVDICTTNGNEVVSMVSELIGNSLAVFVADVEANTSRLGNPQWSIKSPPKPSSLDALVQADWQAPEGERSVVMIGIGPKLQVYRVLSRQCR